LDLALGGGIAVIDRPGLANASGTIVVRGPPGSGKTILGSQLAVAIARSLSCEIAYACVEILPTEVEAQLRGFEFLAEDFGFQTPPFFRPADTSKPSRIYASILNIGDQGETLGDGLSSLLKEVREIGGRPRVVVIDSLSDGYGLGASVDRRTADGLCKFFIETGVVGILLEEATQEGPSPWNFACESVIELGHASSATTGGRTRQLVVSKHRFGPCDLGPHSYEIHPASGVEVFPRLQAYWTPWAKGSLLRGVMGAEKQRAWFGKNHPWLPSLGEAVVSLHGHHPSALIRLATALGTQDVDLGPVLGSDVFVEVGRVPSERPVPPTSPSTYVALIEEEHPDAAGFVGSFLGIVARSKSPVRRVVISDLRALTSFADAPGYLRAFGVLSAILKRRMIPTILVETADHSPSVHFADVDVSVSNETNYGIRNCFSGQSNNF